MNLEMPCDRRKRSKINGRALICACIVDLSSLAKPVGGAGARNYINRLITLARSSNEKQPQLA